MPGPTLSKRRYPPIADYGLIADCHSAALVSRQGSIDWCCMPRFDSGSVFGRMVGWDQGGYCRIAPAGGDPAVTRRYLDGTMVLETNFQTRGGDVRVLDCFTMTRGGAERPQNELLRVIEGVRGRMRLTIEVSPRFDYGEVRPWVRQEGVRLYSAIGGNDALLVWSDADIAPAGRHDLAGTVDMRAGQRLRLSLRFVRPEWLDDRPASAPSPDQLDGRLDETVAWWRRWSSRGGMEGPHGPTSLRSALVLKALTNARTGAMVAAATTSLPEVMGGPRNWDYRFSWVRDSSFAVRSLADLGHDAEADGFRRFIERSAAGSAEDLQIMYGVGGERRLVELELERVEGYRQSHPVRVGNAAATQPQLDVYGHLLELAWRWHERGHSPDDDYWKFLVDLVEAAAARWEEPDCGIWEMRGKLRHFVHSKVMCWVALDRGLRLARECGRRAPERRWRAARKAIVAAVERDGYDHRRGIFVQAFGGTQLDAALLLLPSVGFVDYDDERMVRTTDAIRSRLSVDGLLLRYRGRDSLPGREGVFLACSFWLTECLARQRRLDDAREVFDRAASTANDLGLFSEQFGTGNGEMLGNFPQGLTHLSQIMAALALQDADRTA